MHEFTDLIFFAMHANSVFSKCRNNIDGENVKDNDPAQASWQKITTKVNSSFIIYTSSRHDWKHVSCPEATNMQNFNRSIAQICQTMNSAFSDKWGNINIAFNET